MRLQQALVRLARSLDGGVAEGWVTAKDHARAAAKTHAHVAAAWHETEERVIPLPHGQGTLFVMFGAPRDLWSANRLLSRSMNLPLAEAVPNLLVGVGLLFTFFFLTLALTEATSALLPSKDGVAAADLTSATRGLLSAAGAKFLTSLTGLFEPSACRAWRRAGRGSTHHCYIGLPRRRIPPCHNARHQSFFGAICGLGPITSLTRQSTGLAPAGFARRCEPVIGNVDRTATSCGERRV